MRSFTLYLTPFLLSSPALAWGGWGGWGSSASYKHVLVFSVDGLHSNDIGKYLAIRPKSTIAQLLETGVEFTDAYTSAVCFFAHN